MWKKRGLLWQPNKELWWQQHYGILPTPEYLPELGRIRLYFATTCAEKYGRVTYIEVDANDPSRILYEASAPILDVGAVGYFDDCGLNPSCVVDMPDGEKWLYYIGYQRSVRVPYMLLAGAARCTPSGWERVQTMPILERTEAEPCIRSATTIVRLSDGTYRMWYVAADRWEQMQTGLFAGKLLPNYRIRQAHSVDGRQWQVLDGVAIDYADDDEFGFGRPWVLHDKRAGVFRMWYSIRRRERSYRIGYAESKDGDVWQRKDEQAGIDVSESGWDSEMICYPAVVQHGERLYLFYNGNNNGATGFGWAEWQNK